MEITIDLQQAGEPVAIMRLQGSIDASNFVQIVDNGDAQPVFGNPEGPQRGVFGNRKIFTIAAFGNNRL